MSKYLVCIPSCNGVDEYREYEGYDAEDAATKAGRHYNEDGDYALMNNSVYMLVKETEESEPILISVSAEPDVYYSANECTSEIKCRKCGKDMRTMIFAGKEPYDDRFCDHNCYLQHLNDYRREHGLEPHAKGPAK